MTRTIATVSFGMLLLAGRPAHAQSMVEATATMGIQGTLAGQGVNSYGKTKGNVSRKLASMPKSSLDAGKGGGRKGRATVGGSGGGGKGGWGSGGSGKGGWASGGRNSAWLTAGRSGAGGAWLAGGSWSGRAVR